MGRIIRVGITSAAYQEHLSWTKKCYVKVSWVCADMRGFDLSEKNNLHELVENILAAKL